MENPMTIRLSNAPSAPQPPQPVVPQKKRRRFTTYVLWLAIAAFVLGGGYGAYAYFFSGSSSAPVAAGDTQNVIDAVGKLMVLPDETPTVAVVSDLSKLQDQAFFANAKLGDVVLMYPKTRKAILYSPSKNKIIEVAPITASQQ